MYAFRAATATAAAAAAAAHSLIFSHCPGEDFLGQDEGGRRIRKLVLPGLEKVVRGC